MDEFRRLRWRCRRGMQELDLMLRAFMDRGGLGADRESLEAFSRLLDCPDDVLLDLLMKRAIPPDKQLADVIEKVRSAVAPKA